MIVESGVRGDFPYAIHTNDRMGFLLGYVGVPNGHPWDGKDYDEIDADVHGGLTFASRPNERDEGVYPADFEGVAWWVGFDCGHVGDVIPSASGEDLDRMIMRLGLMGEAFTGVTSGGAPTAAASGETFKDRDYVSAEIDRLIDQAASASRDTEAVSS